MSRHVVIITIFFGGNHEGCGDPCLTLSFYNRYSFYIKSLSQLTTINL
jgi:hypothetical protein